MVRAIKQGFDSLDHKIEEVAIIHGANKFYCFFSITVPQMLPSIITGITLAFARCLAEFGATIIVAGNIPGISQTLPLAIFTRISSGDDSGALNLIIISVTLGVISITINKLILSKKV